MKADPETDMIVGQRLVLEEPMSIILNFGISSECAAAFKRRADTRC